MNTEAKYFAQFRGDPPTYEQAVLLLDPAYYSPGWHHILVAWNITPEGYTELTRFVDGKKEQDQECKKD